MKRSKAKKLFRVRFPDGKCIFIISQGWSGLVPLVTRMAPTDSDKIYLSQVSLFDYLRYIVKGV